MSINEDKEEKERRNKIEIIKYLGKFWNVKQNILPERMPQKQTFYKKEVKSLMDALIETDVDIKEKLINLRNKKQLRKSSSSDTMKYISPNAKTIISKIGKNVKKIKNSITDITRMNGLFLEQTARKTFNTYRANQKRNTKTFQKMNLKNEKLLRSTIKDEKELNEEQKGKTKYNKTQNIKKLSILNDANKIKKGMEIIKDRYVKNFVFVNDNYRRQLNFAFLKYNPTKHLEDLKFLVETEPLIRKDIIGIKKDVEDDIKFRCDKNHFRKKYELIKKRFQRSKSVQGAPKTQFQTFKNNLLPKLNNKKLNKTIKVFSPNFTQKKINIHDMKKNEEESKLSKLVFPKEEKMEELKHMLKASSGINSLIQDENINNKIDLYRTKYEEKAKLNELYDTKDINLLEKDYFEEEKKNIVNQLGDIYQFQMDKNLKEKEIKLNGKISNDNDIFKEKLSEQKRGALKEINNLIEDHIFL